jgi:chitin disaccharide deacetylase
MTSPRRLIVNADDFGLSPTVNQGIIAAHEKGIVTSTSLMVRWPAAAAAADYARAHPKLGVGLHLDLGEWVYANQEWRAAYQVVSYEDEQAVAAEIDRQLRQFSELMGRAPTHLDSHQHVHLANPIRALLLAKGASLEIVVRSLDAEVRYCGDFYGQSSKGDPYPEGISVEALRRVLAQLPPGATEMGCHPGAGPVDSAYSTERAIEMASLCHPSIREAIAQEGIELCSFEGQPGRPAS